MAEPELLVEKSDGIATLTLNRPEVLNALSTSLREAIARGFVDLKADPGVGVVILTGAGRAFCAGIDLKELAGRSRGPDGERFEIDESGMIRAMREFDRPIIGAINGFAVTGGFELALMCDVLIASSQARFADTHARVGVLPGWGLSQKLPRLIGALRAKELSLTGNYISAEQAESWGLVNRVVPPERLLRCCRELARDVISCEPDTVRAIKQLIDDGLETTLVEGLRTEAERSRAFGKGVSTADIGRRRDRIQSRGRRQFGD
ncbi:MAG: enoyl-CoA hydratase [Myxococcota bacterium]